MPTNKPSPYGPIYDIVLEFFEGDEWNPEKVEASPALSMQFEGDNGKWTCLAYAYDERERFVFFSVLPVSVPEEKRTAVAEFLTRANFGMELGNFEMDFEEGDVQFRTSIDIEGGDLTPKMIQNIAYSNVVVADQYLPGLVMVLEGDASPVEAITKVEQQPSE
jgi:hypothetical protein